MTAAVVNHDDVDSNGVNNNEILACQFSGWAKLPGCMSQLDTKTDVFQCQPFKE